MSSNNETRMVQGKRPEEETNLTTQYRKIGIRAVAAAANNKAKKSKGASGDQERKNPDKEKTGG